MNRLRQVIVNKYIRTIVIVIIIGFTFGVFGYYLVTHPEVGKSVTSLDGLTLVLLTLAYLLTVLANAFVLLVSLRLLGKHVAFSENIALTSYSSVVNFFGPLQSGPGFRAAYLKKRHSVSLKNFFYVTLIFYGFYGLINGLVLGGAILLLASNNLFALLLTTSLLAIVVAGWLLKRHISTLKFSPLIRLNNRDFWFIGLGAAGLSVATALAYYIELLHVEPSITIGQTIVYTAAANLALFVSLTPGAIGFRESFLLLSQQLHGISSDTIIAASIIDRAFYVIFLLVLFLAILVFNIRSRFKIKK